jgi:RNA polymerase sigma-70 factor (ECF subfamily)
LEVGLLVGVAAGCQVAGADDPLAITDADLVARIATGDVDAPMAELCRRYETWLYRCGLQALGDTGLAQDMVQECFVRLWRNAAQFDPGRGSVATYLLVIGRSVAADIRKRPSSRPLEQLEEGHLPPQMDSVDQILSSLMVRDALDSLTPAHRQVLALNAEGLTQSQIAARLELPLGTVKTRAFHAMRALRAALARQGFNPAT